LDEDRVQKKTRRSPASKQASKQALAGPLLSPGAPLTRRVSVYFYRSFAFPPGQQSPKNKDKNPSLRDREGHSELAPAPSSRSLLLVAKKE